MQIVKIYSVVFLCSTVFFLTACESKTENQTENAENTVSLKTENTVNLQEQIKKADEDFKKCVFDNFQNPEKCNDKEKEIRQLKKQLSEQGK